MDTLALIGEIILLAGALLFASAGIGIIRYPDAYTRVSAVGTAGGLGISLVIIGAFLTRPSWWGALVVAAIIFLHLATSSIGTSATARAAYLVGTPMRLWSYNELKDDEEGPGGPTAPGPDDDEAVRPVKGFRRRGSDVS